jgi:hypothetical protein
MRQEQQMQGTPMVPRGVTRRVRVLATLALAGLFAALSLGTGGAASAHSNVPQLSITPLINCYWANADGTTTFSIGYRSTNAGVATVDISSDNRFHPSQNDDRGQPTSFDPGTHNNVFAVTVTAHELDDDIQWELLDNKVDVATSTKCAKKPVPEFGNAAVLFFGGGLLVVAMLVIGFGLGRTRRAPVTA